MPAIHQSEAQMNASRHRARMPGLRSCLIVLLWIGICCSADAQLNFVPQPKATSKEFGRKQNRLAREASPYLRMHADNPVDWYPWGPEALQAAMKENKPIFLSIGYSTCFWCHVMEEQVFNDPEIAAYMNQHFINIKVDREERPDLDDIYMIALQVYFQLAKSSQGGGWPLSIFLTPDCRPIAGGTYFPPKEMPGQTSFPTVLRQIQKAWTTRETDVRATAELITREVIRLSTPRIDQSPIALSSAIVDSALKTIEASYDPLEGGFDFDPDAPEGAKFPSPCKLQLLQACVGHVTTEDIADPANMLDHTLERMAMGGIWDHLGGGFHRYSTDRRWKVPHFEKMLYDNAQLAEIYVEAYRRTGREQFRQIAMDIFDFVKTELTGSNGEFYSALDAQTDGVEGAYYVWSLEELQKLLSAGDLRIFSAAYGVDQPSAFEAGYVLHLVAPVQEIADTLGMPQEELQLRLREMRKRLLDVRRKRPALTRDDKVLTGWNGLMIRAYARGGQILKRQDYLEAASRAAIHILATHRDPNGGLLRTNADPPEDQPAFLEDYALFVSGLLALHEATHEDKWLNSARRLTDDQVRAFRDQKRGGFYFTAATQEVVLARMKHTADAVLPSGNSVSAQNLIRLSRLKTDDTYRRYAEEVFAAFSTQLKEDPDRAPYLMISLQEYLHWYGNAETHAAGDGLFSGAMSKPTTTPQTMEAVSPEKAGTAVPDKNSGIRLLPSVADTARSPHAKMRGQLNVDRLPRGGECRVAFEFDIEPGWHLNANPAKPEFVTPLAISLKGPTGISLKNIVYPKGRELAIDGIQETLSVYEGRVVIFADLSIPPDAAELNELQFEIRIQACNAMSCQPKVIIPISISVPGAPVGQPVEFIKSDLFQADPPPFSERLPATARPFQP